METKWLRRAARGAAVLLLALGAQAIGLLGVQPAFAQRLNIKRTYRILTSNLEDQFEPAISGRLIVFTDRRNGNEDIGYYDLATDAQGMVVVGPQSQRQPDIFDHTIVYTDFGTGTGGGDIYAVTLGGSPTLVAGDPASAQTDAAINGTIVVWEDARDGNPEIYGRDLAGGPMRRLTSTPDADEVDPSVSGTRVVFARKFHDGTCQIFLTDFVTGDTRQISHGAGCFQKPDIDGDTVVYDGNPDGNQDVYVYNVATSTEHRVSLAGVQRTPHVSGDWLTAEKGAVLPFPNFDAKIYNIPRDAPFGAVTTEFNETAPDISGTRVAYQTDERGNLDIGVVEFELVSGRNHPPIADAGPDQSMTCSSVNSTPLTLDGSGSTDFDGDPITFAWSGPFPENGGLVPGMRPTVHVPLGTSSVNLVVNDAQEDSVPDTMSATVRLQVDGLREPMGPLVAEGSQPAAAREFKQGSTLPLKLLLSCGGAPLTAADVAPPAIVAISGPSGAVDPASLDLDNGKANGGGGRFRVSAGQWMFNLSTRSLKPGAYVLTIQTPDGQRYVESIVLK